MSGRIAMHNSITTKKVTIHTGGSVPWPSPASDARATEGKVVATRAARRVKHTDRERRSEGERSRLDKRRLRRCLGPLETS
jgi:hypothetical protein